MNNDQPIVHTTESSAAPTADELEVRWVICPNCFYEREAGIGCGLPCV